MKRIFSVNKASSILALFLVFTLFAGVFAFFTDRVTTDAHISTSAGLDIEVQPDPTADPDDPNKDPGGFTDPTPTDPTDDLTNWWAYLNSVAKVNYNPGDKMDLSYNLVNSGDMAVDVRETFIIKTNEPMTDLTPESIDVLTPEFQLFTAISQDANGAYDGTAVAGTMTKIDETHYMYVVDPYTLSGSSETVDGSTDTSKNLKYYVVFNENSGNDFQGVTCEIFYVVEAKQHSTGADDWDIAASATLPLGDQDLSVVPAIPVVVTP